MKEFTKNLETNLDINTQLKSEFNDKYQIKLQLVFLRNEELPNRQRTVFLLKNTVILE